MASVTLGNLYDANRAILKTMAPVEESQMKIDLAGIGAWMSSFPRTKYFMLMCKERSDFTLIHIPTYNYLKAVNEIREVLEERGTLLGVNYVHGENCYECWIREEAKEELEEPVVYMFMLFDADWMVLDIL